VKLQALAHLSHTSIDFREIARVAKGVLLGI
jgi:hypothetical protein